MRRRLVVAHGAASGARPARPASTRSRRRRLAVGLAVCGGAIVVLLGALEIGVRLLVPGAVFGVFADVYAADADPEVGYTFHPSFRGPAFGVELATNELGYRGQLWQRDKVPGTLRVALVGDSHAFGFGVAFEQTLGEHLRRRLATRLRREVEVLNFGVNGYNARQQRAVLATKVLPLRPDVVLVVPCNNDADDALWADADGYLRRDDRAAPDPASGRVRDHKERTLTRIGASPLRSSRLVQWLVVARERYRQARAAAAPRTASGSWFPPLPEPAVAPHLREPVYEPLHELLATAKAAGARVALLPYTAVHEWRATLHALARATGAPMLELVAVLGEAGSYEHFLREWSLGWDSHMGPAAQAKWAEAVERFLVEEGLVE